MSPLEQPLNHQGFVISVLNISLKVWPFPKRMKIKRILSHSKILNRLLTVFLQDDIFVLAVKSDFEIIKKILSAKNNRAGVI